MIPIGLGLAWAGYTVGIWGYCMVRGYDVTFAQCFKVTWPAAAPAREGVIGNAAQLTAPKPNTAKNRQL